MTDGLDDAEFTLHERALLDAWDRHNTAVVPANPYDLAFAAQLVAPVVRPAITALSPDSRMKIACNGSRATGDS